MAVSVVLSMRATKHRTDARKLCSEGTLCWRVARWGIARLVLRLRPVLAKGRATLVCQRTLARGQRSAGRKSRTTGLWGRLQSRRCHGITPAKDPLNPEPRRPVPCSGERRALLSQTLRAAPTRRPALPGAQIRADATTKWALTSAQPVGERPRASAAPRHATPPFGKQSGASRDRAASVFLRTPCWESWHLLITRASPTARQSAASSATLYQK